MVLDISVLRHMEIEYYELFEYRNGLRLVNLITFKLNVTFLNR